MDKKLLGNFIIAFPPSAHIAYTVVMNVHHNGIDWYSCFITGLITAVSFAIGRRIKSKGEVE